jgi:large subunit ribosomal protein L11
VAKEIFKKVKLQIPAGKANPAPPVGTVLGPVGINLQEFCQRFNDASKDRMGDIVPVEITIYQDKTYDFVLKTTPAPVLIKKYAKIQKGSTKGANDIVATITKDDLRAIAEIKLPDLNAYDVEAAMRIIEGTARNMGVAVKGLNDAELAEQAKEAEEAEREQAKRDEALAEMEKEAATVSEVEVINEKTSESEE